MQRAGRVKRLLHGRASGKAYHVLAGQHHPRFSTDSLSTSAMCWI